MSQETIQRLMIRAARRGKRVVRLKAGDPFVFGRGGEEALALMRAGIPFDVVPGVTSPSRRRRSPGFRSPTAGSLRVSSSCRGTPRRRRSPIADALPPRTATLVVLMGVHTRAPSRPA